MLAQLAARLRQDGIELRIARDIGQFRDVIDPAVPGDFSHSVFRDTTQHGWTVPQKRQSPTPASWRCAIAASTFGRTSSAVRAYPTDRSPGSPAKTTPPTWPSLVTKGPPESPCSTAAVRTMISRRAWSDP